MNTIVVANTAYLLAFESAEALVVGHSVDIPHDAVAWGFSFSGLRKLDAKHFPLVAEVTREFSWYTATHAAAVAAVGGEPLQTLLPPTPGVKPAR